MLEMCGNQEKIKEKSQNYVFQWNKVQKVPFRCPKSLDNSHDLSSSISISDTFWTENRGGSPELWRHQLQYAVIWGHIVYGFQSPRGLRYLWCESNTCCNIAQVSILAFPSNFHDKNHCENGCFWLNFAEKSNFEPFLTKICKCLVLDHK